MMVRLSHSTVAYTETEVAALRRNTRSLAVTAAPNALYARSEIAPAFPARGLPTDLICVGRLVAEKKPELLLAAFLAVRARLPGLV